MKKIIKYLLALILFVPFFVKADMGAPILRTYEAEIVKEAGADYYSFDDVMKKAGHLDKGTVLEIDYEEKENNILYLMFDMNEDSYYIKAEDVVPKEKEVTPKSKNVDKMDSPIDFKIYADEVVVRKGPSVTYDEVGTLKKGTQGSYSYYIDESGYIYVDVNGLKGWVDTLDGTVLFRSGNYVLGEGSANKCGKIPVNTIVTDTWHTDMWTGQLLVEYNGCQDFIPFFKVESIVPTASEPQKVSNKKAVKLYSTITKKKVLANIPKNTVVDQISIGGYYEYGEEDEGYQDDILAFVSYNGKTGWAYMPRDEYPDGPEAEDEYEEEEEEPEEAYDESEPVSDETLECEDENCDASVKKINIPLICTVVGAAIALASLVTIIIVNKKSKAKKGEETLSTEEKIDEKDEIAEVEEEEETKKEE